MVSPRAKRQWLGMPSFLGPHPLPGICQYKVQPQHGLLAPSTYPALLPLSSVSGTWTLNSTVSQARSGPRTEIPWPEGSLGVSFGLGTKMTELGSPALSAQGISIHLHVPLPRCLFLSLQWFPESPLSQLFLGPPCKWATRWPSWGHDWLWTELQGNPAPRPHTRQGILEQ